MGFFKNLLGMDMSKGKSFFGGLAMIGLGAYLIATGDIEKGIAAVGNGAAIWGIADKIEKSTK